jgi:hypothetical protein
MAQYSLGKWITLLAKYSLISSSGKSVCSISFVNTMLPLPSSHVSVGEWLVQALEDSICAVLLLWFVGHKFLVSGAG